MLPQVLPQKLDKNLLQVENRPDTMSPFHFLFYELRKKAMGRRMKSSNLVPEGREVNIQEITNIHATVSALMLYFFSKSHIL